MLSLHHLLSSLLASSSTENWWKICCRDQTRKITQACFNQLATFADILSIAAIFVLWQGRGEQIINTVCFLTVHRFKLLFILCKVCCSIYLFSVCICVHFGFRALQLIPGVGNAFPLNIVCLHLFTFLLFVCLHFCLLVLVYLLLFVS